MKKLESVQLASLRQDIVTIAQKLNHWRIYSNQYIKTQGLNPTEPTLDPYFLYEGGAEITKQFSKDWQMAAKIAMVQNGLNALHYIDNSTLLLFDEQIEEVSKSFFWVPGQPIPNKWTGNKHSQTKPPVTLLLSFGCNNDGTIKKFWAAIVYLFANPDGKTGDWKFSDSINSGFSSLLLTQEITRRQSFQQVVGETDMDYKSNLDPKKGMQLTVENLPPIPIDIPK